MSGLSERAQATLARFAIQFLELAPERLALLQQVAADLATGDLNEARRCEAQRVAHNMAGMAKTVGFPAATPIARRIERQLAALSAPGDPRQARLLQRRLKELRQALTLAAD